MSIPIKQLERIVRDYVVSFPALMLWDRDTLVRRTGPLLQCVLFNRSSGNDYQPKGYFWVVTDPIAEPGTYLQCVQELPYRRTGVLGRRVRLENHELERSEIAEDLRNPMSTSDVDSCSRESQRGTLWG